MRACVRTQRFDAPRIVRRSSGRWTAAPICMCLVAPARTRALCRAHADYGPTEQMTRRMTGTQKPVGTGMLAGPQAPRSPFFTPIFRHQSRSYRSGLGRDWLLPAARRDRNDRMPQRDAPRKPGRTECAPDPTEHEPDQGGPCGRDARPPTGASALFHRPSTGGILRARRPRFPRTPPRTVGPLASAGGFLITACSPASRPGYISRPSFR